MACFDRRTKIFDRGSKHLAGVFLGVYSENENLKATIHAGSSDLFDSSFPDKGRKTQ
jgi:hypothetical protein